jgi:hypothetical protein
MEPVVGPVGGPFDPSHPKVIMTTKPMIVANVW